MLVSVITICFNSEAVIRKTIESVLNQTWDKLEYLIVDGASKDRTVAIAEEYSERFAAKGVDYRIYSEPDRGIYDAMNKGIRLSSGDLVGLINSGDWYEPDAVETAVKAYEKEPYDLFRHQSDKRKRQRDGQALKEGPFSDVAALESPDDVCHS